MYQDIIDLPLSRFIDLTVNGNPAALVAEGYPAEVPVSALNAAAERISQQYTDAIGDMEYKQYCQSLKEITLLQVTLDQINNLIDTMRQAYSPVLAKALNSLLSVNFTFDITNLEVYDTLLDRCRSRSKGIQLQLTIQENRFTHLREKFEKTGVKPTREYYKSILLTLSDSAGFNMTEDTMTVWEFAERMRRHQDKMTKQKQHV